MSYVEKYHWINKTNCLARDDGKTLISSPGGYIALTEDQYNLLKLFDNQAKYIDDVVCLYPEEYRNNILAFIELLIKKNVLIEGHKKYKLTVLGVLKKFMFFPLPYKFMNGIITTISKYISIRIISVLGALLNILGMISLFFLVDFTNFTIESVPRNMITFLIGFIAAISHEFWLAIYVKKKGRSVSRWYFKMIFGVFITISTNWSEMLLTSRKNRILMFIFVINMTICTASIESLLGIIAWKLNWFSLANYLCSFAMGTLIFMGITLWPFLFKGDGYYIFQELTKVYKLRPRAIRSVFMIFQKEQRNQWMKLSKKEKIVLFSWGFTFVVTIILLEYFLYLGVRIII